MSIRDTMTFTATLALGLTVWGCGPPEITPVAPPGVDISRPKLTEADAAQALGEAAGQAASASARPRVVPESQADSPPTEQGQTRTKESGLSYVTLRPGKGEGAKRGQTVTVHYTGKLQKNGEVIDDSRREDKPYSFQLGSGMMIPGFDEGVTGMKVGETRSLTVPSELGYGKAGRAPAVPPNSPLVFEVELLKVE